MTTLARSFISIPNWKLRVDAYRFETRKQLVSGRGMSVWTLLNLQQIIHFSSLRTGADLRTSGNGPV